MMLFSDAIDLQPFIKDWLRALRAGDLKRARSGGSRICLVLGRTKDEFYQSLEKYTSIAPVERKGVAYRPLLPTIWVIAMYRARSENVYQRVTVIEAK
jgi:hypothetical protein